MARRMIYVTFRKRGLHRYAAAPAEVDYLAHPHRHTFWFKVSIEVRHNDRDIEFHLFRTGWNRCTTPAPSASTGEAAR